MGHFTTEDILAYVADKLSQEQVFRIEAHLTECEKCARKVDDFIIIRERFDELWDSWGDKGFAQEVFAARILESIARAEVPAGLRERAIDWIQKLSQKTQAALGIVIDAPKKTAQILREGMETIFASQTILSFAPVTQPVRTRGEEIEKGVVVEAHGPPWVEVTVDPSVRKVTVRAREVGIPWPLVMLIPKVKGTLLIGEFEHPEDTDFLLAEFSSIPDKEYILLLEGQGENEV